MFLFLCLTFFKITHLYATGHRRAHRFFSNVFAKGKIKFEFKWWYISSAIIPVNNFHTKDMQTCYRSVINYWLFPFSCSSWINTVLPFLIQVGTLPLLNTLSGYQLVLKYFNHYLCTISWPGPSDSFSAFPILFYLFFCSCCCKLPMKVLYIYIFCLCFSFCFYLLSLLFNGIPILYC